MRQDKQQRWTIATALLVLCCGCEGEPETYTTPPDDGRTWILSDHYHARKQNQQDYWLSPDTYSYQGIYGFRRLFEHLEENGYPWRAFREQRLTPEMLEGFSVLFINLVSDDRPTFSEEEVATILDYVDQGGGLFVIADHSNVYYSSERINPFLKPMGVEVLFNTAVDDPPQHSIGKAWVMVESFEDHPVTKGLDLVCLKTGTVFDTDHGVAFTSDESFADLWDESKPEDGFCGNWTHDGDDKVEPRGPLPVVAAAEYGEGRLVVVGDQNIFGDGWLHYGDDFRLAMNAFAWVAKKEDEPSIADIRPNKTFIGVEQRRSGWSSGFQSNDGYMSFFINISRMHDLDVAAQGSVRLTDDEDIFVLLNPRQAFSADERATLKKRLADGTDLIISFDASNPKNVLQLLADLAPELVLESGDETLTIADENIDLAKWSTADIKGPLAVISSKIPEAQELSVAAFEAKDKRVNGTLVDVSTEWGEPLLQAKSGDTTLDIARVKTTEGGRLVLFLQDALFQNRTFGDYDERPNDSNRDAHLLQKALLGWLVE